MANNNTSKDRKGEAEKRYDGADNAGRFAGNDADARAAHDQAAENIRQNAGKTSNAGSRDVADEPGSDNKRDGALRDPAQSHDTKGEAQNVNDDTGRPLSDEEARHARNKATEGRRQGREEGES